MTGPKHPDYYPTHVTFPLSEREFALREEELSALFEADLAEYYAEGYEEEEEDYGGCGACGSHRCSGYCA